MKKGFCDDLKVDSAEKLLTQFQYHVYWLTDGVPQRVHEYCLELARIVEDNNWTPEQSQLVKADGRWNLVDLRPLLHVVSALIEDLHAAAHIDEGVFPDRLGQAQIYRRLCRNC